MTSASPASKASHYRSTKSACRSPAGAFFMRWVQPRSRFCHVFDKFQKGLTKPTPWPWGMVRLENLMFSGLCSVFYRSRGGLNLLINSGKNPCWACFVFMILELIRKILVR